MSSSSKSPAVTPPGTPLDISPEAELLRVASVRLCMEDPGFERFIELLYAPTPCLLDFASKRLVNLDDYDKMATELKSYLLENEECLQRQRAQKRARTAEKQCLHLKTQLQIAVECPLCKDNPKNTRLHPCGHVVCNTCANGLKTCPTCSAQVEELHSIFL